MMQRLTMLHLVLSDGAVTEPNLAPQSVGKLTWVIWLSSLTRPPFLFAFHLTVLAIELISPLNYNKKSDDGK